jgi:hypothetical protein
MALDVRCVGLTWHNGITKTADDPPRSRSVVPWEEIQWLIYLTFDFREGGRKIVLFVSSPPLPPLSFKSRKVMRLQWRSFLFSKLWVYRKVALGISRYTAPMQKAASVPRR